MIVLELTKDIELIKSILTNPVLWRLTMGQSDDESIENFEPDMTYQYLTINDQYFDPIGLFMVKELTKTVLEVHIFILPKYWGTDVSIKAAKTGHMWAKKEGYLKTFTRVPANCTHVLKYLEQINYHCCGQITKGIVHNKLLASLFLYDYEV